MKRTVVREPDRKRVREGARERDRERERVRERDSMVQIRVA